MADYDTADRPAEDDLRMDDEDYNPQVEPKSAKAWLNLLQESEDAFEHWNDHCDRHRQEIRQPRAAGDAPGRRVSDVLGQLRGAKARNLRPAAGAGRGAKIQGSTAGVPGSE